MTVTNRSSVAAADVNGVKVDDPRSFRTRLISLRTSQGTCRPYPCDLGRLAPGASATVIAVTEATQVGASSTSSESARRSRSRTTATTSQRAATCQAVRPASTACRTLIVEPRALQSGRSSVVRLTARNSLGRPLAGVRVLARGPGVDRRA